jgi:hypothetical protein
MPSRDCARSIDGQYCGRPYVTTQIIEVMTSAGAPADLTYQVDLCAEHGVEYDREHL